MDYREEYDAVIDLKDMLFYILHRWRSILLAAAMCCALLAGYKAVRNAGISQEELTPQKIKDYEFELAQYELDKTAYEQELKAYSDMLEHQKEYVEKSVLMHTDPYCKPIAAVDVFVKLDNAEWEGLPANLGFDMTDSILKAYTSNVASALDWEPIEALTGSEKVYLEELLYIGADYNSNTFTVRVVYSDGQTAQEILDLVLEQILSRQTEIEAGVGQHALTVSNKYLSYTIDSSLAESQRNNVAAITDYEHSILELRMELEGLDEPERPFVVGFAKYPAAGFALGLLLMGVFYGAAYLLDGKLHGERSLQNRYGYALLGIVPHSGKKVPFARMDHLMDRLAGIYAEPEEEAYRRIALNIANLAGNGKKILLTGTVPIEKLQVLSETVSPLLNEIELVTAADMNLHADSLETLAECDAILLAEEEGKSLISGIRKEHDSIAALGKPVVGYVLL